MAYRDRMRTAARLNAWPMEPDFSFIDARFIPFFGTDTRLRVDGWYYIPEREGETPEVAYITGLVGATGGYKPTLLLMPRKDSVGSPWSLINNGSLTICEIKRRNAKRYEPWVTTQRYEEQVAFYKLSLRIPRA